MARASGISESTIRAGLRELEAGLSIGTTRVRRAGGGRKPIAETDPSLVEDLERLVDPESRGDPEQPLRWTAKSVRKLAEGLRELGHEVSHQTVARLLRCRGYSLQANAKTREGSSHPDRDRQFRHINETAVQAIAAGEPLISVDPKRKELVGDFKAVGRELRPKGSPTPVRTHDFVDKQLGKAIPYGVYDIAKDSGFVNVGIDADTAQFSVASIQAWWQQLGSERYPDASCLTITADCGGSNGNRTRLWKTELQRLANDTGLELAVCHFGRRASSTLTPHPTRCQRLRLVKLGKTLPHRVLGQSARPRCRRDPAIPKRAGLRRREPPPLPLIQPTRHQPVTLRYRRLSTTHASPVPHPQHKTCT